MATFDEKHCFEVFAGILGRKIACKHWKDIYLCILAVDLDLKNAYLVDQCCIKPTELIKLIKKLRYEKLVYRNDLHVVVICGDIFVLQRENILKYLKCLTHEQPVCFIDVSQTLNEPKVLKNSDVYFCTAVKEFCLQLNDFIQQCGVEDLAMPKTFEFGTLHPCTVFGIILGYPVVYWLTKESEINCLTEVDLIVYSTELSFPTWQEKGNDFWTVCSFSFPRNLEVYCKKFIESWKANVVVVCQKQMLLVHRIKCQQARLPVVIL